MLDTILLSEPTLEFKSLCNRLSYDKYTRLQYNLMAFVCVEP